MSTYTLHETSPGSPSIETATPLNICQPYSTPVRPELLPLKVYKLLTRFQVPKANNWPQRSFYLPGSLAQCFGNSYLSNSWAEVKIFNVQSLVTQDIETTTAGEGESAEALHFICQPKISWKEETPWCPGVQYLDHPLWQEINPFDLQFAGGFRLRTFYCFCSSSFT